MSRLDLLAYVAAHVLGGSALILLIFWMLDMILPK